jgi:hypothetical protein
MPDYQPVASRKGLCCLLGESFLEDELRQRACVGQAEAHSATSKPPATEEDTIKNPTPFCGYKNAANASVILCPTHSNGVAV